MFAVLHGEVVSFGSRAARAAETHLFEAWDYVGVLWWIGRRFAAKNEAVGVRETKVKFNEIAANWKGNSGRKSGPSLGSHKSDDEVLSFVLNATSRNRSAPFFVQPQRNESSRFPRYAGHGDSTPVQLKGEGLRGGPETTRWRNVRSLNSARGTVLIAKDERRKEEKPTMKPRTQGKSKFKGKGKEKEDGAAGTDGYRDRGALSGRYGEEDADAVDFSCGSSTWKGQRIQQCRKDARGALAIPRGGLWKLSDHRDRTIKLGATSQRTKRRWRTK